MQRYIAFAWNDRVDGQREQAEALNTRLKSTMPEFRCVLSAAGLHVYQAGDGAPSRQVYVIRKNRGIVIGKLFRRGPATDSASPVMELGDIASRKIVETAGRYLVEHYWGRYVAMIYGGPGCGVLVLRDPTGAMPCQRLNVAGIDVICSHIVDCYALGLVNCSINWDHIARFLWFHRLVTPETGLDGVSHVLAGECVTLGDEQPHSTFYWRPDVVHDEQHVEDPAEAMRRLNACIQACVAAWSSCYGSILHRLSGGLDSAIVLACLSSSARPSCLIAQNFHAPGAEGDERNFARAAALRAGIPLFETPLDPLDRPFEEVLNTPPVVSPTLTQLIFEDTLTRDRLIRQQNTEAVFSGQGGDHLFQRTATPLIAAEYVSRNGMVPGLRPVVADTARFTNESVWSVMAAVAAFGLFQRQYDPYVQRFNTPPFISAATQDALDVCQVRHPWVDSARHLPAAKLMQVTDIIDSQNFYNTCYPGVEAVHPLISQPIVELCLQIPSYVLTYGGIDRALVRDAFSNELPPEIVRRTSKGGTTRYVYNYLVYNLAYVRELLLDGSLTENGILDRAGTEACLTEASLIRDATLLFPIISSLRAEAWLNSWARADRRAVA